MPQQREWIANAILSDNQGDKSKVLEDHLNNVWMRGIVNSFSSSLRQSYKSSLFQEPLKKLTHFIDPCVGVGLTRFLV